MQKILIVEDDTTINEMVARNLKMVGHKCTQVYDGKEGLEMIENGDFDLVLLDVMLPGIDGFNLKMNVSILSLMRQCTDYALRYSHNSDRWFGPVLAKHFFE